MAGFTICPGATNAKSRKPTTCNRPIASISGRYISLMRTVPAQKGEFADQAQARRAQPVELMRIAIQYIPGPLGMDAEFWRCRERQG